VPTIPSYHINLTGTPYENGQAMGNFVLQDELLSENLADRLRWFNEYDKDLIDFDKAKICEDKTVKRLPSLFDEIRGFTEAVNISYERYLYYFMFDWEIQSHCSQFSILSEITKENKAYTGHSWEWTMDASRDGRIQTLEEDNIYVIKKNENIAYMGFALNYFGFWNGMNKHGVSANPTGGVPIKESSAKKKLFNHGLVVRTILELCKSADEALEIVSEFAPLSSGGGGGTLIVSDPSGKSYYIERADTHFEYWQVGQDTDIKYQCATNHFVNPRMFPYASGKGVHSIVRYNAMNAWIEAHKNQITMDTLLEMQQRHLPDGPCCHYYAAYLGTVRSMVYNLTDRKAMVCFGSPILNDWHAYDFNVNETEMHTTATEYTDEEADPEIWQHIQPEEEYLQ
jgi:predicted choloylglycine hydrolase